MKRHKASPPYGARPGVGACACRRAGAAAVALLELTAPAQAAPIRNVILFIGDGMGAGQVAAARCYAGRSLSFEAFPHQGQLSTLAAEGWVADSAAAATAMATGHKVYNEVVSLASPGDGGELETVLERFSRLGKSTGLVTSSFLTDATPAAFGAHEASRQFYDPIAADYLVQTRPHVLLGGGGYGLSVESAQAAGYQTATNAASLAALGGGAGMPVAGLFGSGPMPYVADGLGDLPSLAQMTAAALERLARDPDGFFLMVEGGRIDHACHGNDLWRCVAETLAFDEAVRVVAAWAQARRDTLVVVTADHETGGLAVLADCGEGALPEVGWESWGAHTAAPVGVSGFGVNAERVAQLADNTGLWQVLCSDALMPAAGIGIERSADASLVTRWAVNSGDVCRVESAFSLAPPAWQPCGTVTAVSTRVVWTATNQTEKVQRFFRVMTLPAASPE